MNMSKRKQEPYSFHQPNLIEVVNISKFRSVVSRKLRREEHITKLELKHNLHEYGTDIWCIHEQIDETWRKILGEIIADADDDDVITGYIEHAELAKNISLAVKTKADLRYDEFLNAIGKIKNLIKYIYLTFFLVRFYRDCFTVKAGVSDGWKIDSACRDS